jgi:hypothetical protein
MFVDGVQVGSTYGDSTVYTNNQTINIGRWPPGNASFFNGLIDEIRITKGFSRYISNFTPPSSEFLDQGPPAIYDEYFDYVSLLLHMEGADTSKTFIDSSINAYTASVYGNTLIKTTTSKFGSSAGYFDGNGDYLQYNYDYDLNLIGGDFTVECWVYITSYKANGMRIASGGGGVVAWNSTNGIHWLFQMGSDGTLNFQHWNGSGSAGFSASTIPVVPLNTWTHISLTVSGSTAYMSVNGSVESSAITNITRPSSNPTTSIATIPGESGNSSFAFAGYMDDFRITRSIGRYTSNFTPSSSTFADQYPILTSDPYFSSVSLLLHMNGSNNSTSFVDSSPNSFTISSGGNCKISTTQSKFGGASAYYYPVYGSQGGYISAPHSNVFEFGSGDFTIEFFIYYIGFEGAGYNIYSKKDGSGNQSILIAGDQYGYGRIYTYVYNTSGGYIINPSPGAGEIGSIQLNTWHHYALSRKGNNFYIFWNGVLRGNIYSTDSIRTTTNPVYIGSGGSNTQGFSDHSGYIDDLRVTKGVGRYDRKFIPTTSAYQNQ